MDNLSKLVGYRLSKARTPKKTYLEIKDYPLLAENTRNAYGNGWNCFLDYCQSHRLRPLPALPKTVSLFLKDKSGDLALGSLRIYLGAINKVHVINGHQAFNGSLEIQNTLKSIARSSNQSSRRVKALVNTDLEAILNQLPTNILGLRDGALLGLGFSAALRRSEICSLRREDIAFVGGRAGSQKMFVHIRRSKTDQTGQGYKIGVINGSKIRPISRLKSWLAASQIKQGYLFRSLTRGGHIKDRPLHHSDVSRLVKHYVATINLDPDDYSGHSLRAGFITSAAIHKARIDKIMEISRHKSIDMVMSYVRDSDIFKDHAGRHFL